MKLQTYITIKFEFVEYSRSSSLNRKCLLVLSFIAVNSASVTWTETKQIQLTIKCSHKLNAIKKHDLKFYNLQTLYYYVIEIYYTYVSTKIKLDFQIYDRGRITKVCNNI